jgi:hypothetical protein
LEFSRYEIEDMPVVRSIPVVTGNSYVSPVAILPLPAWM